MFPLFCSAQMLCVKSWLKHYTCGAFDFLAWPIQFHKSIIRDGDERASKSMDWGTYLIMILMNEERPSRFLGISPITNLSVYPLQVLCNLSVYPVQVLYNYMQVSKLLTWFYPFVAESIYVFVYQPCPLIPSTRPGIYGSAIAQRNSMA